MDRARVSPRLWHHGPQLNPHRRTAQALAGRVDYLHGLKWEGDSRNRQMSQSQWQGEPGLRRPRLLLESRAPSHLASRCGPPSLLLFQGRVPEVPGICLLKPSFSCSHWGGEGRGSLAQRPQARPPAQEEPISPPKHHGKAPPALKAPKTVQLRGGFP